MEVEFLVLWDLGVIFVIEVILVGDMEEIVLLGVYVISWMNGLVVFELFVRYVILVNWVDVCRLVVFELWDCD